uniref:Core shell protein Gag P30 domain-containing protein n=1 Tax=Cyanistes caeruleus TaxID=156563 RepID=A0A8C0U3Q6_CYACU
MGQCVGKSGNKKNRKEKMPREIPPNSPLGKMLRKWEKEERLNELDKVKMIKYCTEIWPKESISEGPVFWPWYGSGERWLCLALIKHVSLRETSNEEEVKYASCWLDDGKREEEIKVYKVTKESEKGEEEKSERKWDPLENLPPPPPPTPPMVHHPPPLPLTSYPTLPQASLVPSSVSTYPILEPTTSSYRASNFPVASPMTLTPSLGLPVEISTSTLPPRPPLNILAVPAASQSAQLTDSPSTNPNVPVSLPVPDKQSWDEGGHRYNTRFQTKRNEDRSGMAEKLFPLREVPMGGARGGIGFVNAPLTASEVRNFKKEIKTLLEDPIGISNQLDQFLGPSVYTWEELNSILNILFSPEENQLIRAAAMRIWERENRIGPRGEEKVPNRDPGWNPNEEEGRGSMRDYRTLMIRGIREAVPRANNAKLAFDSHQEKEETPSAWLERLRRNFQLYSSVDPESPEGQVLVKIQFV